MTASSDSSAQGQAAEAQGPPSSAEEIRFLKTDFLARLAHELRGPAGVVLGALDELESGLGDRAKQRLMMAMARRNMQKLLQTSDRLSRSAQLEAGPLQLSRTAVDLATFVKRQAAAVEEMEGRRSVRLELSLPNEPCLVELDPGWIEIALAEIIGHALRSARGYVRVVLAHDAELASLTVGHDGTAPCAPAVDRFRSSADRRDAGLGMPLVRDVAAAHGGDLELVPASSSADGMARLRLRMRREQPRGEPTTGG